MIDRKFLDEANSLLKERELLSQMRRVSGGTFMGGLRLMAHSGHMTRETVLMEMQPEEMAGLIDRRLEEVDDRLIEMGVQP